MAFPPAKLDFTADDFLTEKPYEYLQTFGNTEFLYNIKKAELEEYAKSVGFRKFNTFLKAFVNSEKEALRMNPEDNQTEFDGQEQELNTGVWKASDWGIYRDSAFGGRDYACAHAIYIKERLVNIDTGEVKLTLAFKRSAKSPKCQEIIVDKATVSTARSITALSGCGISVTSTTASSLVDYLNDLENLNYEKIPERKSIGRLGYIPGEGFSPYVDGLVFDGDAEYKSLYDTIHERGNELVWYKTALECRKMSVTARIVLASSFASPLLNIVNSLPFFVHQWGVDSGTGKTVALMLAASVWGDPTKGKFMRTFNATQVGQEYTAAFLNHLPYCMDELQLVKDSKGRTNFDVYQLAEGAGRSRGKRSGGISATPTWDCCFLTTGESPLNSSSSGAGAINRVIEIECTAGNYVITDGQRVSYALRQNYGFAGRRFIEKLYNPEGMEARHNEIRSIYSDFLRELNQADTTEKQAMASAAILTADLCATAWIFKDDIALTVEEIKEFLASREAVSAGKRAYDWMCDWVASNANHFAGGGEIVVGETFGLLEYNTAYIIRGVFNRVLTDAGYSVAATLSYLKSNNLIETRKSEKNRGYTKGKRINGVNTECVVLSLQRMEEDDDVDELPL